MKSIKKNREFMSLYHEAMSTMYASSTNLVYCESSKGISSTIAFSRVFPNSRMVEVSVSYCAVEDTYDREIGALLVLTKFNDGRTVQMPLGSMTDTEIAKSLSKRFN